MPHDEVSYAPIYHCLDSAVGKGGEGTMEEKQIEQRFHLLQQEVEAAVSLIDQAKLNCAAATDALKIEIEVLRRFMEHAYPDFPHRYAELRAQVLHAVDPEWIEPHTKE